MMLAAGNAIGVVNGFLFVFRHVADAPAVIGCADHRKADRFADSNCVAHQLRETRCGLLVWYGQEPLPGVLALSGSWWSSAAAGTAVKNRAKVIARKVRRMGLSSPLYRH